MIRLDTRPSAASTAISITAAALMGLGVVMVFSSSASLTAPPIIENLFSNPSFRQATFNFAALVIMLMVGLCPYESWRIRERTWFQPAILLGLISIALLVAVLIPGIGEVRNGARRWLSLGPSSLGLSFQPSELAKLAIIVLFAGFCSHMGERIRRFWTGLLPMLLMLAVVAGLVGIEDFGTGALLALVGACILLAAGAKVWHLALTAMPGAVGLAYLIVAKPYRLERLKAFLDPFADPQGSGYHQVQSLITIASGGWWGQGLGAGIQKYGYLPEGRTDFIFAVICEELGLVGGIAVLGLFAVLLWSGRRAMLQAHTEFGRLLALGVTLTVGFQAAMNVAVVTVSIPTKGIGLPLVSAGGSGVMLFGVLIGLMINVARHRSSQQTVHPTGASIDTNRPCDQPAPMTLGPSIAATA